MFRFRLLLLSTVALAAPALAQEVPAAGDIVVTATGVAQPADQAGQAVTIVTRADLEQRQTVSLVDYLATTPGVTVTRSGPVGSQTSLRIRGAEAEQTLVLIDGVRVNDPTSPGGAFDFGNLLAGGIDRVEVLRGADSVPWGSQAIGGVVNIVTQAPTDGLQAHANAEYGYHDTLNANAGVSGKTGPVSAAFTGGVFRSDGISAAADGSERDGYKQYAGTGSIGVALAPGIGIDLRGYYAHSKLDLDGYAPPAYTFGDDAEYSRIQEIYGYAGAHANFAQGRANNRIAFTISDINRDNYDPTVAADPLYSYRGRTERYDYQGDFRPIDTVRIVAGADHEDSHYFDGSLRTSAGVTSEYGELIVTPVDPLTLTGGIRHDDHEAYGSHTTFGADAALALASGTTLRASYGEGFKAPTLYELYSDYGTRSLVPETAKSFEAGVEQSLLDGRARASVTYFHRDTRHQIDFQSCPADEIADPESICYDRPYGTYANVDRARAQGVEFALALRPVDQLTINASYTYTEAKNRSAGANHGNDLARRPRNSISVSADYRFPFGLSVGGTILAVSDSYDDAGNVTRLDGYAVAGIRAEMPVTHNVSIYGRIDNLFDEKYQTVAGYGSYGRAAYGGVRLRFE
ncbi:TonB-dependent receptor plug domain-containing protein [Hephaestia mangrovi]|uniref:TonB-dependent receptor plug domain-containing protein n=1 Tax=Hephaestia mangrovi TaxID=2873268 RepID=UPI00210608B0|nr:TonB-dependent receptor [Hephaestia mangrovi]